MDGILPTFQTSQGASTAPVERTDELQQDAFLRLLTEQLQNQDPLDPMKNEEFVAQLAQFSSLEQLFGLQETMEAVYLGIASMNNASMATLLGTEVVANGDTIHYSGSGSADLHFETPRAFGTATITVSDENGRVVKTWTVGAHEAGEFSVAWDGKDRDGQPVADGDYQFAIDATDDAGESVDVQTLVVGIVDEMDYSSGTPRPSIQGVSVALESIRRLTSGPQTSGAAAD